MIATIHWDPGCTYVRNDWCKFIPSATNLRGNFGNCLETYGNIFRKIRQKSCENVKCSVDRPEETKHLGGAQVTLKRLIRWIRKCERRKLQLFSFTCRTFYNNFSGLIIYLWRYCTDVDEGCSASRIGSDRTLQRVPGRRGRV